MKQTIIVKRWRLCGLVDSSVKGKEYRGIPCGCREAIFYDMAYLQLVGRVS